MNNSIDSTIINEIELDDFDWFLRDEIADLPSPQFAAKLKRLTGDVNASRCGRAWLIQLENRQWFLRWEERHPKMIPSEEFFLRGEFFKNKAKRAEWAQLKNALPSTEAQLPLSREQAFSLFVAHNLIMHHEFEKEHAAMLDPLCSAL